MNQVSLLRDIFSGQEAGVVRVSGAVGNDLQAVLCEPSVAPLAGGNVVFLIAG